MLGSPAILWLLLAAFFLILECCTVALVSLWFIAGSLAGLLVSVLGGPVWLQILAFLTVSGLLLALVRPMLQRKGRLTRTNVDGVIGTQGFVTEDIDNLNAVGQVKLGTMYWSARSTAGQKIPKGTPIRADRIEGVKVYVSPLVPEYFQNQINQN